MNDKTAKLIRKYSSRTEEDHNAVRRRWNAMNQDDRRRYRLKMKAALVTGGGASGRNCRRLPRRAGSAIWLVAGPLRKEGRPAKAILSFYSEPSDNGPARIQDDDEVSQRERGQPVRCGGLVQVPGGVRLGCQDAVDAL